MRRNFNLTQVFGRRRRNQDGNQAPDSAQSTPGRFEALPVTESRNNPSEAVVTEVARVFQPNLLPSTAHARYTPTRRNVNTNQSSGSMQTRSRPRRSNTSSTTHPDTESYVQIDSSTQQSIARPSNSPLDTPNRFPNQSSTNTPSPSVTQDLHTEIPDRSSRIRELIAQLSHDNVTQQAAAAETLFNMTHKDTLDRQKLYALGACEPLVQLLYSQHEQCVLYSTFMVHSLCSVDPCIPDLLDAGIIPALLTVLNSPVGVSSRRGAIRALSRLSRTEDIAIAIVAQNGLNTLKTLLKSSDVYTLRRTLLSIYFIGADKLDLCKNVADEQLLPLVLNLCQHPSDEVKLEAVDAIKVLSRSEQCGRAIIAEGGVEVLETCIGEVESALTVRARKCLKRLSDLVNLEPSMRDSVNRVLASGGAQGRGGEGDELWGTESGGYRMKQLRAIMQESVIDNVSEQRDLLVNGTVSAVCAELRSGEVPSPAVPSVLRSLHAMAQTPDNWRGLYAANAVGTLVAITHKLQGRELDVTARIFSQLAQDCNSGPQIAREGLGALLDILQRGGSSGKEAAITTLCYAKGDSDEGGRELVQAGIVPRMVDLIWRGPTTSLRLAASSLCQCLMNQQTALATLASQGGLQALVAQQDKMQRQGNADLAQHYSELIDSLVSRTLSTAAAAAIRKEREMQHRVSQLIEALENIDWSNILRSNPNTPTLPPSVEQVLRMIPREAFIGTANKPQAYYNVPLSHPRVPVRLPRPEVDVAALLSLNVQRGMKVLDIGFGTGLMTSCFAFQAGAEGKVVGIEVMDETFEYGKQHAEHVLDVRQSSGVASPRFMRGDALEVLRDLVLEEGMFDRVYVGEVVNSAAQGQVMQRLFQVLKADGKIVAGVDGQLIEGSMGGNGPVYNMLCKLDVSDEGLDGAGLGGSADFSGGMRASGSMRRLGRNSSRVGGSTSNHHDGYQLQGNHRQQQIMHQQQQQQQSHQQSQQQQGQHYGSGVPQPEFAVSTLRASMRARAMTPDARAEAMADGSRPRAASAAAHRRQQAEIPRKARYGTRPPQPESSTASTIPPPSTFAPSNSTPLSTTLSNVASIAQSNSFNPYRLTLADIQICRTADGKKCRLGEGGFGVVYKALMNGVDEVAVKVVKPDKAKQKEFEQFGEEVRVLASLHHRNIVQFYGACVEAPDMFFVTELMKGGDLYSALRHHKDTMQWDILGRKVALDVSLGINYLHTRKPPMMHRDLKSPNVLLSEEGVAKIADVGMVRSQCKDLVTAQPVMTPLWAAPEVTRHERASIKADIWSYGVLIWEIITQEDITDYTPLAVTKQAEANRNAQRPSGKAMVLPRNCPPVVSQIFEWCTRLDPNERPTAGEIANLLRGR